jgi:hypothetical protein
MIGREVGRAEVGSVMLTRRLFFEAVPRSLGELERRFALATAGSDDTAGALDMGHQRRGRRSILRDQLFRGLYDRP